MSGMDVYSVYSMCASVYGLCGVRVVYVCRMVCVLWGGYV